MGIVNFPIVCVILLFIPRRYILFVESTTNPPRKQFIFKILTSLPVSISNCNSLTFIRGD